MSILQRDIPGARVLDLFSGSGALGLECLSRGAVSAAFVEKDPRTIKVLSQNIETLGAGAVAVIHRADAARYAESLGAKAFDIAVADPPYATDEAEKLATLWLRTPFASILSIEHDSHVKLPEAQDTRRYGSSSITFYRSEA